MDSEKLFIGIIRAELYFPGCKSLKGRRKFLLSLKYRLRNMGLSATQFGDTNLIQQAWIGAVYISGRYSEVQRILNLATKLFYNPEWELIDLETDIITPDSFEMEDMNEIT